MGNDPFLWRMPAAAFNYRHGVAKEIILTGRVLEVEEVYRLGIYNHMVPLEKLDEETINLAKGISENPPVAVKQAKKLLDLGADISAALDFDFEASKECFFSDALGRRKTFQETPA